jgi:hypothetical protein
MYPRTARATGSRSTSTTSKVIGPRPPPEYDVRMCPLSCPTRGSHNSDAEYYSVADAIKEAIHLRQLMWEILRTPVIGLTAIWVDNHNCIACSQNALVNEKITHIGLKYHFVKEHAQLGTFKLRNLPRALSREASEPSWGQVAM